MKSIELKIKGMTCNSTGVYKLWAQFQQNRKLITALFVVEVE